MRSHMPSFFGLMFLCEINDERDKMSVAQLASRELILFDLDGTLVDSAFDLYRAMNMSLISCNCPTSLKRKCHELGLVREPHCLSQHFAVFNWSGRSCPASAIVRDFLRIYNAEPCIDTKPFNGVIDF